MPKLDSQHIHRRALELGISAVGIARAEEYTSTVQAIHERMQEGLFADLKFTMARPESSCHPELLVDGSRSIVSAALCYWTPQCDDPEPLYGQLARYTRTDAYDVLGTMLEELADEIRGLGFTARVVVDSNDHVDREAAARSGVGFYGKHTNIITKRHGSWVVLGALATSADLEPDEPMRPGCGSCTACIDACPTDAISPEGGVLDVRRCITYWTQSRHSIPDDIRPAMGTMVYGCDICQEVCPWNVGVERRRAELDVHAGSVSLVDWLTRDGHELIGEYRRLFIPRRDANFLRRNALIALGNSGDARAEGVIRPYLDSPNAMLREHAEWALTQLEQRQP